MPGRYKKTGMYLLRIFVICRIIAHELMLSVENATLNKASLSYLYLLSVALSKSHFHISACTICS